MTKINRRNFLKTYGWCGRCPGVHEDAGHRAGPDRVHILRWNDFVPACDAYLKTKLFPEAEKALGIKVKFETVNANDLQARITSGIQAGAGPDVIMLNNNHPISTRRASSMCPTSRRMWRRARATGTRPHWPTPLRAASSSAYR